MKIAVRILRLPVRDAGHRIEQPEPLRVRIIVRYKIRDGNDLDRNKARIKADLCAIYPFLQILQRPAGEEGGVGGERHDLRHGAATLLVGAGVHPRVAQQLLRHASSKTTTEIYSHVTAAQERQAADAMPDGIMSGNAEQAIDNAKAKIQQAIREVASADGLSNDRRAALHASADEVADALEASRALLQADDHGAVAARSRCPRLHRLPVPDKPERTGHDPEAPLALDARNTGCRALVGTGDDREDMPTMLHPHAWTLSAHTDARPTIR